MPFTAKVPKVVLVQNYKKASVKRGKGNQAVHKQLTSPLHRLLRKAVEEKEMKKLALIRKIKAEIAPTA